MDDKQKVQLERLSPDDAHQVVHLIALAMNEDEGLWAKRTFREHFACAEHGIDDGRRYFVYRKGVHIVGLVGLHHYNWGPPGNVWLAWFAVHPDFQRQGLGGALIDAIEQIAVEMGYSALFVETYEHDDFDKARSFYEAKGFTRAGSIDDYLPDGSAMVVYRKGLLAI